MALKSKLKTHFLTSLLNEGYIVLLISALAHGIIYFRRIGPSLNTILLFLVAHVCPADENTTNYKSDKVSLPVTFAVFICFLSVSLSLLLSLFLASAFLLFRLLPTLRSKALKHLCRSPQAEVDLDWGLLHHS